jgi:thioredoxin-like negative regulator of GroEL
VSWQLPHRLLPLGLTRLFRSRPRPSRLRKLPGAPILVEIHADWCPTCKAQNPILDRLTSNAKFKDLKIFRVDFDAMKPVVKQFGAQMQSTLIVFKGTAEQGRSVGDTKEASIEALLDKSL